MHVKVFNRPVTCLCCADTVVIIEIQSGLNRKRLHHRQCTLKLVTSQILF